MSKRRVVCLSLDKPLIVRVDAAAKRIGTTRSALVEALITTPMSLDEYVGVIEEFAKRAADKGKRNG